MKISGQRDYHVSLESVAMTDIVLNMFIFFFISFSLLYTFNPHRVQKLEIKLPQASTTSPINNKKQIHITLTKEGKLYLDNQWISFNGLKSKIDILHKDDSNLSIVLNADQFVPFKEVVQVVDILRESGITNLNIAAINDQKIPETAQ